MAQEDKRTVYVKIVFMKISDIDTVKEQYTADVFVQSRWREKTLDKSVAGEIDASSYWNPKMLIQNIAGDPKEKIRTVLRFNKENEAFIVQKRRIKGVFTENLELEDFPFDNQDLSIIVTSERTNKEIEIVEDNQDVSALNVSCLVDEQEWHLSDLVESEEKELKKELMSDDKELAYPALIVKCIATRRPGFFVWNIIIIMTLISSLSFCAFVVDRNLPQRRLQLGFTLTLTGVAFRFVTNQCLPKISYLTKLDKYILFSMIFNYLVSLWHAVISLFSYDHDLQAKLDLGFFIFFLALYIIFQVSFFLIVIIKYILQQQDIKGREEEYQEKMKLQYGASWKLERQKVTTVRNRRTRRNRIQNGPS